MTKYTKLKKKYDDLIKQSLDKNKRILIESFIEYYGEEFRSLIEKRYNEITFVYYIDWSKVDLVIKGILPQVDNIDRYIDFIEFDKARTKQPLPKIFKRAKKQSKLPDNLIGMTDTSIVSEDAIVKWLFKALSSSSPCSYNHGKNRLIAFQILALDERAIIHEINHAITRDKIAELMEGNTPIGTVSKVGLNIDADQNGEEIIIEELINEKASGEIRKIFKSKGGDFSSFCLDIPPLDYYYRYNLYLIDDFYERFKQYIKISRISDDKNELIARVGRDEYKKLVKLVNRFYSDDILQIVLNEKRVLPTIRKLVEQMSKNVDSSNTPSKDEQKAYLEQLVKSGYNLRIIDSQNNELENSELEKNNGAKKM